MSEDFTEFTPEWDTVVTQWKDWNDPPGIHIGDPDDTGQLGEAQGIRVHRTEQQTGITEDFWVYTDEPTDDWDDWLDWIENLSAEYMEAY